MLVIIAFSLSRSAPSINCVLVVILGRTRGYGCKEGGELESGMNCLVVQPHIIRNPPIRYTFDSIAKPLRMLHYIIHPHFPASAGRLVIEQAQVSRITDRLW